MSEHASPLRFLQDRPLVRLIGARVAGVVITLLVVSFLIFSMLYLAPGDTASFLVGDQTVSPEYLEIVRAQYGLDKPFLVRYFDWLVGVLHLDFGQSILFREDVTTLLAPRIGNSLSLVLYSSLLILIGGLILGIVSGLKRGAVDQTIMVATNAAQAVPSFVAAIILISIFSVGLGWFPVSGAGEGFLDRLWHLTLPAVAMALVTTAIVTRITRTAVQAEYRSEHVETARSRGIPDGLVIRRHVIRNGLIPIITVSGLVIASQISAAVVVETAFAIDGLGSYLVRAVEQRDFAIVQAISLIIVTMFVLANLVVDVLYMLIDPRIRVGGGAR
ncbi:MAG: ABC transporter permease [Candidatus Leucobacter sulfamidivorax]|nr:ABC transporter permease [Candidatus Leucobacter sulfamidivorax]